MLNYSVAELRISNDALIKSRIMYYQITFTLDKRIRGRYEMRVGKTSYSPKNMRAYTIKKKK